MADLYRTITSRIIPKTTMGLIFVRLFTGYGRGSGDKERIRADAGRKSVRDGEAAAVDGSRGRGIVPRLSQGFVDLVKSGWMGIGFFYFSSSTNELHNYLI
jgi:hypothetical protein